MVFDLRLRSVFYLWSDDLSPREQAASALPPLPLSVQLHLAVCMFHERHTHTRTRTELPSSKQDYIHVLHMCSHYTTRCTLRTHSALEVWPWPFAAQRDASLSFCRMGVFQRHTSQTAIKRDVLHRLCMGEREQRREERQNETGHE